jgi:hypothetical protein
LSEDACARIGVDGKGRASGRISCGAVPHCGPPMRVHLLVLGAKAQRRARTSTLMTRFGPELNEVATTTQESAPLT